jgi:hypothetical protein
MSNNQVDLCQKLYELCKNVMEHRLHDVEQCLLLHNSKSDFRKVIGLDIKTGLNAYGSEMNLYDTDKGYQLENEYRLLLNGNNYFITPSDIKAPKDKTDVLFKKATDKLKAFDRTFSMLDKDARKSADSDVSIEDVLDNYQLTWLLYKRHKENLTRSPKKFKDRQHEVCIRLLDHYLGINEDEELNIWDSADIGILILIILGALPEYGKSPGSYSIKDSFSVMLNFMHDYHYNVSITNDSYTLSTIHNQIEDGTLQMTKYSLIVSLHKIIDELSSEFSPSVLTDINDSLLFGHRQFCDAYDIQGVWVDDCSIYWSIRETGDYCLMYKFSSFCQKTIEYTKFTLIADYDSHIFNIREASNVMELFKGKRIDINQIDELDVKVHVSAKCRSEKKIVESIELKSIKFRNNLFKFKKLTRVDNNMSQALARKWKNLERDCEADYTFLRSMVAITPNFIYVGSYERDEQGRHKYFYKMSKADVDGKLDGSLYYVDFNQSVGIYKAIWKNSNNTYDIKYYLSIDSKAVYIDTELIKRDEYKGISITNAKETEIVQKFVEMDQAGQETLTEKALEEYSSPFYYLTND